MKRHYAKPRPSAIDSAPLAQALKQKWARSLRTGDSVRVRSRQGEFRSEAVVVDRHLICCTAPNGAVWRFDRNGNCKEFCWAELRI